jgi:Na+-translocating ferredoxin:NAD+ oxidoreductase RnfG subunit
MKRRFTILLMAVFVAVFGATACGGVQQQVEDRAREEVNKKVEEGRKQVEKKVQEGQKQVEKKVQEGRKQVEKQVEKNSQ